MFTRMDQSTREDWELIKRTAASARASGLVGDRVIGLLRSLAEITNGFAVDQLTHSLQTATRAEQAGASDAMVIAALCHDVGKAISGPNHPAIAAEILYPYVDPDLYELILAHQDFQGRHFYEFYGADPNAREKYRGKPWYALAVQFADEWDQTSFDPSYPTLPLEHFEARLRALFLQPRRRGWDR